MGTQPYVGVSRLCPARYDVVNEGHSLCPPWYDVVNEGHSLCPPGTTLSMRDTVCVPPWYDVVNEGHSLCPPWYDVIPFFFIFRMAD